MTGRFTPGVESLLETQVFFRMNAGITVRRLLGNLTLALYSLKAPLERGSGECRDGRREGKIQFTCWEIKVQTELRGMLIELLSLPNY